MIPSIATVTMGGDLPARLDAAAKAGFEAVELFDADLDAFDGDEHTVRRLVEAVGLKVASYFPLRDVEGIDPIDFNAVSSRAAAYMDTAVSLGSPMVMMCSATDPSLSGDWAHIVEDLEHMAGLAAERGLKLAYEALSWGQHVSDYRDAVRLVGAVDHPAFGLVLDSFHIFAHGHSLEEISQIPANRIFLVQVSDAPRLDLGFLDWSRHHRTLPGLGAFDLATFTQNVRATGYDGVFSLECFDDLLKTRPADEVAMQGLNAIAELWRA